MAIITFFVLVLSAVVNGQSDLAARAAELGVGEEVAAAHERALEFWNQYCLLIGLTVISIGVFLCFFGYRFIRHALGLLGFVAGAGIAYAVLLHTTGPAMATREFVIMGSSGACLGLVLAFGYGIAVSLIGFQIGAGLGAIIAGVAMSALGEGFGFLMWVCPLVVGLIGSFVASSIRKPIITLLTAFEGASLVCLGLFWIIAHHVLEAQVEAGPPFPWSVEPSTLSQSYLPITIVLGVIGCIYQFRSSRRAPE